ncbi:sulfotransferase family protein [Nocardia sp. NPDC049149]|uniref:sulfotransferase family protein n=1 Tax=Nocardia sp. NPDC049149 TaxID=3364315 RepID=UPI00370FE691
MGSPLVTNPVLLGGENRSGTTLFSVVLDSHPDLAVGPELDFVEPVNLGPHVIEACDLLLAGDSRVLGPGTDTGDPYWYHGAHFVKQCERFGVPPEVLRSLVEEVAVTCGSDLETLEDRCRLVEAVGEYRQSRTGKQRWGIKLQRKIARVDEFAAIWPRAHFVHIIRDGRDVAASHLNTVTWGYRDSEAAARGWLEVVERPRRVAPVDRYLEIRYEDLVDDPKRTLARVLDFVGVAWRDEVLDHSSLNHSLFHKSWGHPAAAAAAKPLYREQVSRYRRDLTASQISAFEAIAGDELTRLGYGIADAS